MKRLLALGALAVLAVALVSVAQSRPSASAGDSTPTPLPTTAPFEVRFVGLFLAGPTDGVTIEWDAVAGAASYSIEGSVDWLAVRQGEGICVPAGAPSSITAVDTTVADTTTTFVVPLPEYAPPAELIWWPINRTLTVTALDQQGDPLAADTLSEPLSFGACFEVTPIPSALPGDAAVQPPSTGYGPDSY